MENVKNEKKVKWSVLLVSFLIIAAVGLVAIGVMIYGFGVNNGITRVATKLLPYPAAMVGYREWITISELNEDLNSIRNFYEKQDFAGLGLRVDFSTNDGKKRLKVRERELLNKMVEDRIIGMLLKENGAKVTKEAIDQEVSRKLDEQGSWKSTQEKLEKLYGWTLEDFKEKIVRPDLYRKKLAEIFETRYSSNGEKKKKIEAALRALADKKSFADVTREYSEGTTAKDGGKMGWFKKEHLLPGLAEKVFSLEAGKTSEIVETELGFHIAKVEERRKENGEEIIRMSQIFVNKNNFADWLGKKMKERKVSITIKEYYWDKEKLIVQFRDKGLQDFENKIINEFQGDTSVMNFAK